VNPTTSNPSPRIAVIGAGPIGIEAALGASCRGYDVALYDAGRTAASMRRFHWVTLFTPFSMNASARGAALLRAVGADLPEPDALVTAGEFVSRYLEPLTRLPSLAGRVRERSRVTAIGREGLWKSEGIVATGDRARLGRRFLLRVEPEGEAPRFDVADVVIDASGVYATPRATGPGGLPALGEEALGERLEQHLPAMAIGGEARSRYARRRVLLVGDGYSAATALADFASLAEAGEAPAVTWVRTHGVGGDPFPVAADDPLAARAALAGRANHLLREARWVNDRPGVVVEAYEARGSGVRVTLRGRDGAAESIEVDQVLALVGYRPDTSIYRELQIHLCYASEGPMALASAVLAASLAEPDAGGDCLKQVSHGPETLKNPEPDFYIAGSKSYGRNPQFLLSLGHRQVEEVLSLIEESCRAGAESAAP
jgi:hypothetical protein